MFIPQGRDSRSEGLIIDFQQFQALWSPRVCSCHYERRLTHLRARGICSISILESLKNSCRPTEIDCFHEARDIACTSSSSPCGVEGAVTICMLIHTLTGTHRQAIDESASGDQYERNSRCHPQHWQLLIEKYSNISKFMSLGARLCDILSQHIQLPHLVRSTAATLDTHHGEEYWMWRSVDTRLEMPSRCGGGSATANRRTCRHSQRPWDCSGLEETPS